MHGGSQRYSETKSQTDANAHVFFVHKVFRLFVARCRLTSGAQARGTNQREPRSGTPKAFGAGCHAIPLGIVLYALCAVHRWFSGLGCRPQPRSRIAGPSTAHGAVKFFSRLPNPLKCLQRFVRPRRCMNSRHGLPVLSKHRIIASQNRSPQKPAASALKPAAHTTNTKPISKDGAYCHARMMPQRTPRIAPQVNCFQKLSRPCLYSSGVMSRSGLTSRARAREADDVLRDSGTGPAIPRCLQRFVRPHV